MSRRLRLRRRRGRLITQPGGSPAKKPRRTGFTHPTDPSTRRDTPVSRTLTTVRTLRVLPDDLMWGTCRVCGDPNFTLTTTRRIPDHPEPGYRPDRPRCTGSRKHPVVGSVKPAPSLNCTGNYAPIQQGRAA